MDIKQIERVVKKVFERELDQSEVDVIKKIYDRNKKYVEEIDDDFIEGVIDILQGKPRSVANFVGFLGIYDFDDFVKAVNPKAVKKHAYMTLDSRYARWSDDNCHLSWDVYHALTNYGNSTSIVKDDLRNITSIRMHSMVVKMFPSVAQRASILIEELGAQAFLLPNGRRFHFVGLLDNVLTPVDLSMRNAAALPVYGDINLMSKYELLSGYKFNDGWFHFKDRITKLDQITVSIGDPFTLVPLQRYEFLACEIISFTDHNMQIDLGALQVLEDESFGIIYNAQSVHVSGLVSPGPAFDNYVNMVNNTTFNLVSLSGGGHILTITYGIANPGDLVGLLLNILDPFPPLPVNKVNVIFDTYRILMNFEIEYDGDD